MAIVEWAREHPWLAAGIGIVVFIIAWLIVGGGGGSQTVSSASPNAAGAAEASQREQIQASLAAASMQTAAARDVAMGDQATQLGLAQIAKDIKAGEYAVRMSEISATQQTVALQSTLSAQVAESQIRADTQKQAAEIAGSVETTKLYTNALLQQSAMAQQTNQMLISAQSKAARCTGLKALFGGC